MHQQQQLDFDRGERAARRTAEALEELGSPLLQRAVVFLLLAHPAATLHVPERLTYRLAITWRAALEWLHAQYLPPAAGRSHSSIRKALLAWQALGIMHAAGGVLWLSGDRLKRWAEQAGVEQVDDDPFDQVPESPAARSADCRLPRLPSAAFGATGIEQVAAIVREWWREHELTAAVVDPDALLGAIIAARRAEPNDPQRYVEACLARGVKAGLVVQGRKLRLGHRAYVVQAAENPQVAAMRQQALDEQAARVARAKAEGRTLFARQPRPR